MPIYGDHNPEPYSSYRNRTVTKQMDKLQNQLKGIRQNSLRPEHKEILRQKMILELQQFKF